METSRDLFKNSLDKAFSKVDLNSGTLQDHSKYKRGFQEEVLSGGISDNKSIEDIAKKHKKNVSDIKSQLNKGIKVEMEHTNSKAKAKEIAMDHD